MITLPIMHDAWPAVQVVLRQPAANPAVSAVYRDWLGAGPGSDAAQALLHTSYRYREAKLAGTMMVSDW